MGFNTKLLIISAIFVGLIIINACNHSGLKITDKDNGRTIEVKIGTEFTLDLSSNPTTGYDWQPLAMDKSMLDINSAYKSSAEAGRVGVGGIRSFRIKTLKNGKSEIIFGYFRPWEKAKPIKTYKIFIKIN